MSTAPPEHDPPAIFAALERHRVDYVMVGGLAVAVWAQERATKDTDVVVPDADEPNDRRLRAALEELEARPLPLEAPGAARLGIRWELAGGVERYATSAGILDVLRDPEGAPAYSELRSRATAIEAFGARTVVVGREDLIAMKLAASRVQDLLDLDALLDPASTEPQRVAQRARDRELLRAAEEPAELGEAVDPAEHLVDELRRVLTATPARGEFERALRTRARALRELGAEQLAGLRAPPAVDIPASLAEAAAAAAHAAGHVDEAEARELALLHERENLGRLRRSERQSVQEQLDLATADVERLHSDGEQGVEQLRAAVHDIERFYEEHADALTERIAILRERYRRRRTALAERVRRAPEHPAAYVSDTLGKRPSDPAPRERWDHAARAIEAYVALTGADGLKPPTNPDRETRAAWERANRAIHADAPHPPQQQPPTSQAIKPPRRGPSLGR
jgi:hypothetical protein